MNEQVILESTPLNALDRCDRCGAQAYVRAILLNGGELLFCAHHGKEYAEKTQSCRSEDSRRIREAGRKQVTEIKEKPLCE